MLNIYFGNIENVSFKDVSLTFNLNFRKEWFEDELVREIIRDIDGVCEIEGTCLRSSGVRTLSGMHIGAFAPQELSLSSKISILMFQSTNPDTVFNGNLINSEYYKYVFKIARIKDININISIFSEIPYYEDGQRAYIYDTDRTITTKEEFSDEFFSAVERYKKHFCKNNANIYKKPPITVITDCDIIDQKLIVGKLTDELGLPQTELYKIIGKNIKISKVTRLSDDFLSSLYNHINFVRKNRDGEDFIYGYEERLFIIDDLCKLVHHYEDFDIFYRDVASKNYFLVLTNRFSVASFSNLGCNIDSMFRLAAPLENFQSEVNLIC